MSVSWHYTGNGAWKAVVGEAQLHVHNAGDWTVSDTAGDILAAGVADNFGGAVLECVAAAQEVSVV